MRVLVVEDDDNLRIALEAALRASGLAVDACADLLGADLALSVNGYDCVVFDRMLPDGDTLPYVAARRQAGWAVPVLFLTARDSLADRVDGLRHGGGDYLVKPFAMVELVARVRSLGRRTVVRPPSVLRYADVELDNGRAEVRRDGVLLTVTRKELLVLERLMTEPERPVSRLELIRYAWDEMADPVSNVLDVVVGQLRRKLRQPPLIHTVRGVGYRISAVE
ncbi:transcriptional regulatory protein CutR [Longispora fulva]|uniref:DNA-binding response OmpR family regulator n=1 Tax=Longispora fulva TaxID=619741 RepID=A0A8J7KP37_9ACTN|nr:response regulator transcription factor [Longispora fulva]MBG6135867.1 DNA-binding response OmpR family regulator [Longispora fulva]GIG55889.1 transcriptional regulatory protein CutR [Longispora fulva]